MAKLKENPNAELERPQEAGPIEPEIHGDMLKALESPYESGTMENKIFHLCKDSHASIQELSIILDVTPDFLESEMKDVLERGYTACKILLRRQQLNSAKEGDSKQLTWLGKQILGQEDKIKMDIPMTIVVKTGIDRTPLPETPKKDLLS